jgi:hypothetical protein
MTASTTINIVPLVDLSVQHAEVAREVAAGFADVCKSTTFVSGPGVASFEREYARFVGVPG